MHIPVKEPFLHMAMDALDGIDPADYVKVVSEKVAEFMETVQDVE